MEYNSQESIFTPPRLGVRLLELSLPREAVENEVGDLEEEYRDRVQRHGLKYARRWFWIQIISTLGISLKESGTILILPVRTLRSCLKWDESVSAMPDQIRITRHPWTTHSTISMILVCLLTPLIFNSQSGELEGRPAQEQTPSEQLRITDSLNPATYSASPEFKEAMAVASPVSTFTVSHVSKEENGRSQLLSLQTQTFTAKPVMINPQPLAPEGQSTQEKTYAEQSRTNDSSNQNVYSALPAAEEEIAAATFPILPLSASEVVKEVAERSLQPSSPVGKVSGETESPAQVFTATAYSLRGRTASGRLVTRGLIAADQRVLPLGTRLRIEAGHYNGEYVVVDRGGRKTNVQVPTRPRP
jgi:3D (Asp-Asp-Asp) domain-containing protein